VAKGVIIASAMPKGGVGKTSMALSLAACLAGKGEEVFVADCDWTNTTLTESLKVRNSLADLDLPPLNRFETFRTQSALVKKALREASNGVHVIIDCNNAIEEMMLHSMGIADVILVPSIPTLWAMRGYERMIPMLETTAQVRKAHGVPAPEVYSIITRWDNSKKASQLDDFLEGQKIMRYLGRVPKSNLFERSLAEGCAWWERYPSNLRAQEFRRMLTRIKVRRR